MVLHLLSKKSWNVYNPENIARVKKDQAEAALREEEEDRQLQEHDAAHRLAILRGEAPPPSLPEPEIEKSEKKRYSRDDDGRRDERKKRKRVAGEDDTERELRFAREDLESRHDDKSIKRDEKKKRPDAPIVGRDGHINLFPVDHRANARGEKHAEVEAEKARKQRELEDQYTMRLSNAAGKDGLKEEPWYASREARQRKEEQDREKNAWGRPDPARKDREQARQSTNDPLAFMMKAQGQLKTAERDRKRWQEDQQGKADGLTRRFERDRREWAREKEEIGKERTRYRDRGIGDAAHRERGSEKVEKRRKRDDKERRSRRKDRDEEPGDGFRLDG